MAFDRAALDTALNEIETFLGYLRGNENAWQCIRDAQIFWSQSDGVLFPIALDSDYRFPCPETQYQVKPSNLSLINARIPLGGTIDRDVYVKGLQTSISMAWEDGQAWARGVADYFRTVCDPFTKPDATVLKSAVEAMHADVLNAMVLNQINDDWAALGNLDGRWSGGSATAFSIFYQNYNDVFARIGRYLAAANTGFAVAASIINGTQLGAQTTAEETVKALKVQLDEWVRWGMQPPDPKPLPAWVGDLGVVIKDVLSLAGEIPIVGDAVDLPNTVIGAFEKSVTLLKDVEKLTGWDVLPEIPDRVAPKSAEEVYSDISQALYDNYLTKYRNAMQTLGGTDGGYDSGELLKNLNSLSSLEWTLPQVKDGSMKDADDEW